MNLKLHVTYLGLGTNMGDRLSNLQSALALLPPAVTVLAKSSIYQTPPWGFTDQEEFLNQVVRAETRLRPAALLRYLKRIEKKVGRTATFRWGPREIDIDILFYADRVIKRRKLTLPHPRVHQRAFMLVPLAELAPDLIHPLSGKKIRQYLTEADSSEINQYLPK